MEPPIRNVSTLGPRQVVLATVPVAVLIGFFSTGPIAQWPDYHLFADQRGYLGIPNFGDVASNLVFLATGALGLGLCVVRRPPGALRAWIVFFAGVALVSAGSAYYHWRPDNQALVWDRLPMTIGFMGAYVALLAEYVDRRLERRLLVVAMLLGLASVVYWSATDDLRLYFAVQLTVFGSIVVLLVAFKNADRQKRYIVAAFASYAAAVVCEQFDHEIFALTDGAVSGHTIKHLLAGLSTAWFVVMLGVRRPIKMVPETL
ncbi:MAG: ceramidase domain-containing protein [Alphaproteobacteria bacterium]